MTNTILNTGCFFHWYSPKQLKYGKSRLKKKIYLPVTAGVGLGFWVVPSSHMLKTEFLCHFCGKGFSGAAIRDIGYQLDSQWDLSHPTFNLSLIV